MRISRIFVSVLLVMMVTGCSTGYKDKGGWYNIFSSGGFSSKNLEDGTVKVKFEANGYTGSQKSDDFALLRASELCMIEGGKYLEILSGGTHRSSMYAAGYMVSYPKSEYIVKFHEEIPQTENQVLDAFATHKAIREKYKMNEQ